MKAMTKQVILTGLRANNDLHIGHYFGAMLPMVDMAKTRSEEFQVNMFIPDLHSFTTPINHDELYEQILHNARLFVAAGLPLDNPSIYLYRQSYVPAHSELTWILDCFSSYGFLQRMTQFKDKSGIQDIRSRVKEFTQGFIDLSNEKLRETKHLPIEKVAPEYKKTMDDVILKFLGELIGDAKNSASVSMGLLNYPVLMASDILLYDASYVPVGDDQTQHLEFTRDLAEHMNSRFGELFTVPEAVAKQHEFFGKDQGLRIMDLADPTKKMSKSDDTGKGVIFLGDDPEAAAKKIMSATTDDKASVAYDPENQPGISNLLDILALLRGQNVQDVAKDFEGQERYGDFKAVVADEVRMFLTDFQSKLASVDDSAVLAKLESSEIAMNRQANATLLKVQQAVGLRPKA